MSSNLTGTDTATLKNLSVPVNYFEQYRVNTFYGAVTLRLHCPNGTNQSILPNQMAKPTQLFLFLKSII